MGSPISGWDSFQEFPDKEANDVKDAANAVGVPEAADVVDSIKAMLGNQDELISVAQSWLDCAAVLDEGWQSIEDEVANAIAYWEGPAWNSFSSYVNEVVKDAYEQTINAIKGADGTSGVYGALTGAIKQIITTYNICVDFIFDCVASIAEFGGDVWNAAMELSIGGLGKAIADLIVRFSDDVKDAVAAGLDVIGDYLVSIKKIGGSLSEVTVPTVLPDAAAISDNWDVVTSEG